MNTSQNKFSPLHCYHSTQQKIQDDQQHGRDRNYDVVHRLWFLTHPYVSFQCENQDQADAYSTTHSIEDLCQML